MGKFSNGSDLFSKDGTLYNITKLDEGYRISFLYTEDLTPLCFTIVNNKIESVESVDAYEPGIKICSVSSCFDAQVLGALDAYLGNKVDYSSE